MQQTPPNAVAIAEPNPKELCLGLLSGMLDDYLITFKYRGLQVNSEGNSISVSDPTTGDVLGGRLHKDGATLQGAFEWLEAKADLYEVGR